MDKLFFPKLGGHLANALQPQNSAKLIDSTEDTLSDHPMAGRPGRVSGTREWVDHQRYIVAYRVTAHGDVDVLDVVHAARLWPERF